MDVHLLLDRLLSAAGLEDDVGALRPMLLRRLEETLELSRTTGAKASTIDDIARLLEHAVTPDSAPDLRVRKA